MFREMFAHAKVSSSLFSCSLLLYLLTGSINVIATFLPTFDIAGICVLSEFIHSKTTDGSISQLIERERVMEFVFSSNNFGLPMLYI